VSLDPANGAAAAAPAPGDQQAAAPSLPSPLEVSPLAALPAGPGTRESLPSLAPLLLASTPRHPAATAKPPMLQRASRPAPAAAQMQQPQLEVVFSGEQAVTVRPPVQPLGLGLGLGLAPTSASPRLQERPSLTTATDDTGDDLIAFFRTNYGHTPTHTTRNSWSIGLR
jgi:hypothetical protein